VVQNLVENAWKFTARRDAATIEFGSTTADNGQICCYVRDNGAGFDPAYADKLFQPFERLHEAADFPGTGIGLASVQRIIERHGGRVWAEGAVGRGATFSFTLDSADTPMKDSQAGSNPE
jgi:signal transduction histidine kinase